MSRIVRTNCTNWRWFFLRLPNNLLISEIEDCFAEHFCVGTKHAATKKYIIIFGVLLLLICWLVDLFVTSWFLCLIIFWYCFINGIPNHEAKQIFLFYHHATFWFMFRVVLIKVSYNHEKKFTLLAICFFPSALFS